MGQGGKEEKEKEDRHREGGTGVSSGHEKERTGHHTRRACLSRHHTRRVDAT